MHGSPQLSSDALLQHEAFVLRLARSLVRDEATAQDVAQEVWMNALETPPPAESVRGWLARVVRNRASDARTAARRRMQREELAANAESFEPDRSASEQLELQHGVVAAVLALHEPYRSVVIATYFEGLAPAEVARRRGVPAATVRSQLSRALEQLRVKLDREHGDRRAWSAALLGMLELRGNEVASVSASAAAGSSSSTSASAMTPWLLAGSVAFVAAIAFVAWPEPERVTPGSIAANGAVPPAGEPPLANEPSTSLERVTAAAASSSAVSLPFDDATLADVPAILERQRQAKELYHTRWMQVSDADRERFAGLETSGAGGVTRLRERNADADELELPWMRGGGAYFSFSDRVHDYNRRPQIGLQDGGLLASFYGASDALILDLGAIELSSVPSNARSVPPGLDPLGVIAWQAAWRPLDERAWSESLFVQDGLRTLADEALAENRIDQVGWEELVHERDLRGPRAVEGHVYLVRSISSNEHDVVVALQTLHVDDEGCTIAWRLLDSRPVPSPRTPWKPAMLSEELPPPPADLVAMTQPQLRAEIDRLGSLSDRALFERFSPEVEERFGELRERSDAGLIRLIGYLGPWSEASKGRRGGGSYSFGERRHAGRNDELNVQGMSGGWTFSAAVGGYGCSALLDLGEIDPSQLDANAIVRMKGDAGALLVEREFARRPEELPISDPECAKASQELMRVEGDASAAFKTRLRELGASDRAPVVLGHTYALRAVHFGKTDLLVLVHVAGIDDYGVVLAYRILRELPLDAPRR